MLLLYSITASVYNALQFKNFVIFMSLLLDLSATLPGSSVPLTFVGQLLYHNTRIFQKDSEVILVIHPMLQMVFIVKHLVNISIDRLCPWICQILW